MLGTDLMWKRQALPCSYLAQHELESVDRTIIIAGSVGCVHMTLPSHLFAQLPLLFVVPLPLLQTPP